MFSWTNNSSIELQVKKKTQEGVQFDQRAGTLKWISANKEGCSTAHSRVGYEEDDEDEHISLSPFLRLGDCTN